MDVICLWIGRIVCAISGMCAVVYVSGMLCDWMYRRCFATAAFIHFLAVNGWVKNPDWKVIEEAVRKEVEKSEEPIP